MLLSGLHGQCIAAPDARTAVKRTPVQEIMKVVPRLERISPVDCIAYGSRFTIHGSFSETGNGLVPVLSNGNSRIELDVLSWGKTGIEVILDNRIPDVNKNFNIAILNTRTGLLSGNSLPARLCPEEKPALLRERTVTDKPKNVFTPSSGPSVLPPPKDTPAMVDPGYEPDEIVAITPDMESAGKLESVVKAHGYRIIRRKLLRNTGVVFSVIKLPPGILTEDVTEKIRRESGAEIDFNHRYRPDGSESGRQYAHTMIGWERKKGCNQPVRIGLVDSGIDLKNPEFSAVKIHTKSFLPAGITSSSKRHGTAVASIMAGTLNGMLPSSDIFSAEVFRQGKNDHIETTAEYVIYAIEWLMEKDIHVINMSLSGLHNRLLHLVLKKIYDAQVIVVAAAGNNGADAEPAYPAAYDEVIAVTAVDANLGVYRQANQGSYIDFSAPGVDVWAASDRGGGAYFSGTSYAAPFVSVTAALYRHTGRTVEQVIAIMRGNIRDLGENGRDDVYGHGLIQIKDYCNQ